MNQNLASAKKFVQKHKTALIVGAIATTVIVMQHKGIKSLNAFLDEKGLSEEYYLVEGDI